MTALPRDGDLIGGKYRIVRVIGEGGMGTVYEAHHEHLGSNVALKFLHPDLQQSPGLVARFLQEARVSASLKNPHVTQVMDVDQTPDGAAYLVMELLEGESLERRLERHAPLPLAEAVDIGLQILSALEAAHARGVVHRDLKPDNVWLSPTSAGPYVKLLDFGIAKLKSTDEFRDMNTRPGSVMGTPAYMAPEQAISADQVDGRADLYSFGVILYEMLSGRRHVDSEDPGEILLILMRGEARKLAAENPSVPAGLAALVDRLVMPSPDQRPATAALVRAELVPHARASGMVWQGDRVSVPVPHTVPPSDASAPAFLPAARTAVLSGKTETDSMPASVHLGFAPTAVATHPAGKRRRVWPWIVLILFLLTLGGLGGWLLLNPSVLDDDLALPPLPAPLPSAELPHGPLDTPPNDRGERPLPMPPVVRPSPLPARPTSATQAPTSPVPSATTPGPFPSFPMPPFPIPSGLIPSSLPPFFPQIPGWTTPAAPMPAPSTAPPPPSATAH